MTKYLFLSLLIVGSLACNVKPPTEEDMQGTPVSEKEVSDALNEASYVPQVKAYKVGDYGTVRTLQFVMSNSQVAATYNEKVEEINDKYIIYSELNVENGTTKKYGIEREKDVQAKFDHTLFGRAQLLLAKIKNIFKKVEVTRPTAIGQEVPSFKVLNNLTILTLKPIKLSGTTAQDYKSKYFNLKVTKNVSVETANCAQIPGCNVNATKIEFFEVRTFINGEIMKLKRLITASKEVPGLFAFLDNCSSIILNDGGNQIPFMQCDRVKDFRFAP